MAHDIRLVKLINGETVLGKWAEDEGKLKDVALMQTVPTQQGVQMMLLPFGYPFETEISGDIDLKHVLYTFKKFPDELEQKYMEAVTNLTLSAPAGGMGGMGGMGGAGGGGGVSDISQLLKK